MANDAQKKIVEQNQNTIKNLKKAIILIMLVHFMC